MIAPWRAGRDHRARRRLGAETRAFQIDVEHVVPVALPHVEKIHAREHAGIVDQHVERPEIAFDSIDHRARRVEPRHIRLIQHRAPSGLPHRVGDLPRPPSRRRAS